MPGCGCGGSPQVWQPAAKDAAEQAQGPTPVSNANENIRHVQHAQERGVWPKAWTGK